MNKWKEMLKEKTMTADEAVKAVKNGDQVEYSHFVTVPFDLDAALAKRKDELNKVYIRVSTLTFVPEIFKADPEGSTFLLSDGSFSATTRKLKEKGTVYVHNGLYHEGALIHTQGIVKNQHLFAAVTPMDENGFFNLSTTASSLMEIIRAKDTVNPGLRITLEVNPLLPVIQGENCIHITDVDAVVETSNPRRPMAIPKVEGNEIDEKIANHIMSYMVDGACLQLGIGGIPNLVGKKIANSDLKDLGCHTEMFVDAYMDMFNAGKLTNKRKQIQIGKSVLTFAMGSAELYDFMDHNPSLLALPVSYVNDPKVIAQNDNVFSICSCIAVDIFGNVSSESVGYKQVSGTGGQWDYHYASMHSKGGKGFLCMPSAKVNKEGRLVSNIVMSHAPGTQITVSGNTVNYLVTEQGAVNLKGLSTWSRVEALLSVAHPDCRDELCRQAEEAKLWRAQDKQI